jgi:uracil-DNA glycosylase
MAIPARYILIGEAAGYQGCKVSGIPFTSERLILADEIPRVRSDGQRLTSRPRPWSEPSATIVWSTLRALGIADHTILWNAFPWHPHKPGNLHSNRTPTSAERELGLPVLEELLRLHPEATVFAVGRNAEWALQFMSRPAIALRHPSMGGATKFREGLRRVSAKALRSE